jgi:RHS repeat-associated protein
MVFAGAELPAQTNVSSGRFIRGTGSNPNYQSFVVPLDFQKGITNAPSLKTTLDVLGISSIYHLNATNTRPSGYVTNRFLITNSIVAFGSKYGGSPLYYGQGYHFGAYAGDPNYYSDTSTDAFLITAVDRSTSEFAGATWWTVPTHNETNGWTSFLASGESSIVTFTGLDTVFSFTPDYPWGLGMAGSVVLEHIANSDAADYEYTVWIRGFTDKGGMVESADFSTAWTPLYTLAFDAPPPWQATFISQPQFEGQPMPSAYHGKSLTELMAVQAIVTNVISSTATNWLDLDNSPELRQHPTLDQFVTDMGSNALALAAYVQNEIELTDAMSYNDTTNLAEISINPGGVNRSALGTFMEGQGSPVEQCALLVYLLRRAGVPAAYVYPPHNGVQMLDSRLSKLLRMQLSGAVNNLGQTYTTNTLIPVNYPWVAAYVNGQWVHLFPWLKDTEVTEGLNLYDYLPTDYNNGYKWVKKYLTGDTNIFSLDSETDVPSILFTKFLQHSLLINAPGVSVDDIGTRAFNRRNQYARWGDFPTPFAVTNGAVNTVHDLTSITNIFPTWTNIFDTISIQVFSNSATNKSIFTGDLRTADLHNRKFLVRHQTNGANYDLILSLAAYRPSSTNLFNFTNAPNLVNPQQLKMTLTTNDDALTIRFTRKRHRTISSNTATNSYWVTYLGLSDTLKYSLDRPLRLGDLAAICLDSGMVSKKMVATWAQEYWNMQQQVSAIPSITNTLSKDITQGTLPYLMGMAYYERCGRFLQQLAAFHKVQLGSFSAIGLSKLSAKRNSGGHLTTPLTLYHPNVDMAFFQLNSYANSVLHPDAGADPTMGYDSFSRMLVTELSAQEHSITEDFYNVKGGISSVRLLSQSQQPGQPGMLELSKINYLGHTNLAGYDPNMWQAIVSAFTLTNKDPYFANVFVTAAPISNSLAGYKGMGTIIYALGSYSALISGNQMPQNGGWGLPLTAPIYDPPDFNSIDLSFNTSDNSSWSVTYSAPSISSPAYLPELTASWNTPSTYSSFSSGAYTYGGAAFTQQQQFDVASFSLNLPPASVYSDTVNYGGSYASHVGEYYAQVASSVADPVNAVTGEFYIDATDLSLPGQMPLFLRRNYSSQNVDLGDSQFGCGWRPAYQPYLRFVTNNVIYAAELDGTVVAYRQPVAGTNFWKPTLADNSHLNNRSSAGIGSTANLFNNYITNAVVSSKTNYYLMGADGSVRQFQLNAFPITGSTGNFDRSRPYLQKWTDANGNSYTFSYQTDSTQPNYGQLRRIQSSNGNFLGFYFDTFSHITEAYTGDGRRLKYDYDDHGDLVTVTLPDQSQINYVYQHTTSITNSTTNIFSTHLIVSEEKPDGRILANTYDILRRVIVQAATVGNDLNLVTNATFRYSNNFTNLTNSIISGTTYIADAFGRTNNYQYTSNLITSITDALGQTETQTWFTSTNDPGYYPHSLKSKTDKRKLQTDYQYDTFGNIAKVTLTGNLTGGPATNETATYAFTYTSRNLVDTATDPATNKTVYTYGDSTHPMSPTAMVKMANTVPVSTNQFFYTNVVQVVTNGAVFTNSAYGLLRRSIRGGFAITDFAYDGRGFVIQKTNYTGTLDPALTEAFFYSDRGELIQRTDAAGHSKTFDYDAMGRQTAEEVYEANQAIPSGFNYSYYNENGELVWSDGSRYNPEDYVWRDYDGAGRKTTEIHWRSEGKADGSGVQSGSGDDLYATTFYQYDAFNNLIKVTDPLGNYTTNQYDAIGQLTNSIACNTNGVALATNQFRYEPGGQVSLAVNPLGGVVTRQFTYTGQVMAQSNADGSTNGWQYYLDGRPRKEFLSNGNYWETVYDDANRRVTKYFKNASSTLATNIVQMDYRGNVIQTTDLESNVSTNFFDGLDRLKVAAGPALTSPTNAIPTPGGGGGSTVIQQLIGYTYDSSGSVLLVTNALGEKTYTTNDALGRVIGLAIYASNSVAPLRVTITSYSADHQSVTVTNGTGSSALATTTYTDNDGNPVLSIGYPTNGIREYVWQKYDRAGNRVAQQQNSFNGSLVSTWATNSWTYDGLNRVYTETSKDGLAITNNLDALGNLTNRVMPNGLSWNAAYLNDGRIATEQEKGGAQTARSITYQYYPASSPFAGRLQTATDGRGTIRSNSYDDYLRLASVTTSGSADEQKTATSYQYDKRGLVTFVSQSFNNPGIGSSTLIGRTYDGYGHVITESTSVDGNPLSGVAQSWNNAGRRDILGLPLSQRILFGYRADGLMTSAGGSSFGYNDNGLLTTRNNSSRAYTITARDGMGRVLQTTNKMGTQTILAESLSWRNDGHLTAYTAYRGDFTDSRTYSYTPLSQRLAQESFNVSASQRFTNSYTVDNGLVGKLGVLTSISTPAQSSNTWSAGGGLDALNRVQQEQTALLRRPATGKALGAATVSATLDGNPVDVAFDGSEADGRWRANLDLTSGSHSLRLTAVHPSGQYTANVTNTFNVTGGADTVQNQYDGNGNVTQRVWVGSNGVTNRTQTLTWDAFDRLLKVSDRDAQTNGYDFVSVYDGLGRRLRTIQTLVTNGTVITTPNSAISQVDSWYDPQVEFLEVGVSVNGVAAVKTYGPDLNGVYGGLQGLGGFETDTPVGQIPPCTLVSDYFGNALGCIENGVVQWRPTRLSSYGPVPGFQSVSLSLNNRLDRVTSWRGKRIDPTGFIYMGARLYAPEAGRFLSADPFGHSATLDLYSFAGGDPVNRFDPNGRFGKSIVGPDVTPYGNMGSELAGSGDSPIQEWYNSTVLAPMQQLHDDMVYNDQFVGVREARENFWKGALNVSMLGLYNSGSIAFSGYDIYDNRVRGVERGIAGVEVGLTVASLVPWGRVAALGGDAAELAAATARNASAFLDETAPILNPANYRYDPAKLYGGLPLPDYISPSAAEGAASLIPESYVNSGLLVDMNPARNIVGSTLNASGEVRNAGYFWQQLIERAPQMFSNGNLYRIEELGLSPRVDRTWVEYNPTHQNFMNEVLHHHHIDQGPIAVPLPQTVHEQWTSVLHSH